MHLRKNRGSRQVAILPTMAPKTPLLCPVQAQSPSASPVPSALPSQEPIPESSTEPPAPSPTPSCARSHLVSEPPCRRSLRALLQAPVFHLLPRKRAPSRLRNLRMNQVSRQVTILPTVAPKTTIHCTVETGCSLQEIHLPRKRAPSEEIRLSPSASPSQKPRSEQSEKPSDS